MPFGVAVTDYTDYVEGTAGYIIKLDINHLLFEKIKSILAQTSPTSTPEPITAEVTNDVLASYLNSANAPDLAFNQAYNLLSIFFNATAFPYVDATRFDIEGYRVAQAITDDDQNVDVPNKDIEYLVLTTKKLIYEAKNSNVPDAVISRIDEIEQLIEDET